MLPRHCMLLDSFEDAFMDWLKDFTMPTLVVCGTEDQDNGSAFKTWLMHCPTRRLFARSGNPHEFGHQA